MTAFDVDSVPTRAHESPHVLVDLVEPWSRNTPDELAIRYGEFRWTWAEWFDRIERVAGGLVAAGIGHGDRVAVLDKNHPAILEVTFAASMIGAAVAILNWRLADDEVAYAVQDSKARLMFVGNEFGETGLRLKDRNPSLELVTVGQDGGGDYARLISDSEPLSERPATQPSDAALVIYSSGTTGRPKGVVLSQGALVTHTVNVGSRFPFEKSDINLVAMPMFHVGGICWAFLGIAGGNCSIVTRNTDAASILGGLAQGATHTFFVPPVITGLLTAGDAAITALADLRVLGYGAAPMPLTVLTKALQTWPHVAFVQVYGQTEVCGVAVTLQPSDHRDPDLAHRLLSVGLPVPGVEVRVSDVVTGDEVPVGEQGELWMRSGQTMSSYLNRPDATADAITSDSWLKTGDIGRVDADGYVYVEDRLKDMIITGGENVYGPEVERVLAECPGVQDAAVIGVPDDHWGESVKAIVVAESEITEADVIAFCRERLAGYKAPRSVEFMDLLPRNASGKLLKRDLRAPFWEGRGRVV